MKKTMSNDFVLVIGIAIGICLFIFACIISSDRMDVINVRSLGERMCAQHNLTYDSRELDTFGTDVPVIYCKNETVKNIEDGYLKVI